MASTLQEMVAFLTENGLITKYDRPKLSPNHRMIIFPDGSSTEFASIDEVVAYLEGMVKAAQILLNR